MELPRCPDLNEEDDTEQNGYLVGSCEVGSKQAVRQGHDHEWRNELPQIEGCGEQGHDGGGRVLASFDTGNGVQILWSCKLYQAIESFLKIGCKGTNKS